MTFRVFLCFAAGISILLTSCQDRKPAIETFGQLDSAAIAADTGMQVNMDRSYEYMRTFAEGDSVAYDFLAYDKPKGSSNPEWGVKIYSDQEVTRTPGYGGQRYTLERGEEQLDERYGWQWPQGALFYESPMVAGRGGTALYAYESNGPGQMSRITATLKNEDAHYRGRDTFFLRDDRVIRITPYFKNAQDSMATGQVQQRYKLSGGNLILESESLQ